MTRTSADTIFVRARVRTGDRARPRASALAIESERVLAVGEVAEIEALAGPGTTRLDLDGGAVLPGFQDAHIHLAAGFLERFRLDLRDVATLEEVASRVAGRARTLPEGAWVRGFGWDQTRWGATGWPPRRPLDEAAPRHPVFLSRVDGHAAWLSRSALDALGIARGTPDPTGGAILRDPVTGEPSGILLERAMEEARERLPAEGEAERRRALADALSTLALHGITSVEDIVPAWALPLYEELLRERRLTARISAWLPLGHDRREAGAWRERYPAGHPWLSVATLKVFLDGTLGSRSAALLEPYADEPGSRGLLRMDPANLAEEVRRADAEGWAVAVHAIGDAAVRAALDAFERLPARRRAKPHRIEHAQLVSPEDLPRFARAGVVASVQPIHLLEDLRFVTSRLGEGRRSLAYAWRSLSRAGASLAFGSDWPVAPLDPRRSLHAAVTRALAGEENRPFGTEERLTVEEALRGHTVGAAAASARGSAIGVLRPGAFADLVILDRDPLAVPPGDLPALEVRETWIGGRKVYPK